MKQKCWKKPLKLFPLCLSFLLLLSFCACSQEKKEKRHAVIEVEYAQLSLGDIVRKSEIIAYGEVIEKGPVTNPEYATDYDYGKDVSVRVKKGLRNCQEGDTVVYWELGGEAPNGVVYEYRGVKNAEVGDTILVFINEMKNDLGRDPFVEDEDGNVSVFNIFLDEEELLSPNPYSSEPPSSSAVSSQNPYDSTVLPMEEYIEIVEGVIQAQDEGEE